MISDVLYVGKMVVYVLLTWCLGTIGLIKMKDTLERGKEIYLVHFF